MAVTVPFDLAYEFEVKAPAADVFAVLSDVPTSASHFPKVAKLVDMGENTYRWEMEKVEQKSEGHQDVHLLEQAAVHFDRASRLGRTVRGCQTRARHGAN